MANRLDLHKKLCGLLKTRNVYFNPPPTVKMKYPAIIYSLDSLENRYANDGVYNQRDRYSLTYVDKDPDNENVRKLSMLPLCRFNRFYVSDNLNHYTFTLYH